MKILWKQGTHLRNENSRLGFIESVHVQYCNGATLLTPPSTDFSGTLVFKLTQNEPVDPTGLENI